MRPVAGLTSALVFAVALVAATTVQARGRISDDRFDPDDPDVILAAPTIAFSVPADPDGISDGTAELTITNNPAPDNEFTITPSGGSGSNPPNTTIVACTLPAMSTYTIGTGSGGYSFEGAAGDGMQFGFDIDCTAASAATEVLTCEVRRGNAGPVFSIYDLSCAEVGGTPEFDSTPAAGSTITITTEVGVAATSMLQVSNLTPATTLTLQAPTGLSGVLSIMPSSIQNVMNGTPVNYTITCTPAMATMTSQTLMFMTNDPDDGEGTVSYTVQCNGVSPEFSSSPQGDGGTITITTPVLTSNQATLTVSNLQAGTVLNVQAPTGLSGELSISPMTAQAISPGVPVDYTITCTPGAVADTTTQTLTFNTDDTDDNEDVVTYTVECVGTPIAMPEFNSTPVGGSTITIMDPVGGGGTTSTLNVSNTGMANLTVLPSGLSGVLGISPNMLTNVAAGANQDFTITCTAAMATTTTQTLTLTTNDADELMVTYTVECIGTAPEFNSTPAGGSTITITDAVGGGGTTSTLNVSNTGTGSLTVTPSGLSGVLAIAPNTMQSIAAGNNLDFTITCTAAMAGTVSQTLTLTTNDADEGTVTYTVECVGTAAEFNSNPAGGSTITIMDPVGGGATTSILNVSNTGTSNLTVTPSGLSGVLSIAPNTMQTIAAAANLDFTISCAATSGGTTSQTLTLTTNDADEGTVTYTVQCIGTGPEFNSTPAGGSTITINDVVGGGATTSILNVSNTGTTNLTVTPSGLSGVLSISPNTMQTIAAAANQDFTISCSAVAIGTTMQTLTLTTNDNDEGTVTYTVNCVGIGPEFNSNPVGGSTITIMDPVGGGGTTSTLNVSNTGTQNLTVTPSGLSGVLAIAPNTMQTIAAAANQNFTITCTAVAAGTVTQTLTLTTNDADEGSVTYTVECVGLVFPEYDSAPAQDGGTITITTDVGVAANQNLTVSNLEATTTLMMSAPGGLSGVLSIAPNTPQNIMNGTPVVYTITCTPAAVATVMQTLTFTTNDPDDNEDAIAITVNCVGTSPEFNSTQNPATPIALSATVPTDPQATFTVSNTGNSNLVISSINTAGLPAQITVMSSNNNIAPAGNSTITVTCDGAVAGMFNGTFVINTNDNGGSDATNESMVTYTVNCTISDDQAPDPFMFTDVANEFIFGPFPFPPFSMDPFITSNTIVITGISGAVPISVSGAPGSEYSIGCTAIFTNLPGTIMNGQSVCVRHPRPPAPATVTSTTLTIGTGMDTWSSSTIGVDATPDPFMFTDQVNVPRSTLIQSDTVTINGITLGITITVTGGEYSIGCNGTFTAAPGTINPGDTVCVRHTSAAAFSTMTNTVLTIGTVSDTWTTTTLAQDTTPGQFTFVDVTNVPRSTVQTSNTVTISGINDPAPISVTGGEYSIGCLAGGFTTTAGTISDGQTVCVRHTSAATFSTPTDTTLTVGGVFDTFTSTTLAQDIAPDQFTFVDVTNVPLSSVQTSNTVTITGINDPAPISVTGGTYSIGCNGMFTAVAGTISSGQTVCVQHTASAIPATQTNTTLTIGGVFDTFTSTTVGPDTTPDPFDFIDQFGVQPATQVISNTIQITGINTGTPVTVTNGGYSIGCTGVFTTLPGTINPGQTICVSHTSAAVMGNTVTTTLTIGGVSATFSSQTFTVAVPTLSELGRWMMILLVLALGLMGFRQRMAG